jgi:RHS repeat-associated protein
MKLALLWGRRSLLMLVAATLIVAVTFAAAVRATSAQAGEESASVRAELSQIMAAPGPLVSEQGGSGGTGAASPVGGELVSSLSTPNSLTYRTSRGEMITRIYAGPTPSGVGGSSLVSPDIGSTASATQNCFVESDEPNGNSCSASSFQVGYQSSAPAHEHHGLLQFSLSSIPADSSVLNAKLGLYLQSKSTSTVKPVGVYRVTRSWTSGVTWNNYDGVNPWTTPGGDYSNPEGESDAVVNPSVGGSTGWEYWYPTRMVQEWLNGTNAPAGQGYENDGLIVKDQTDNSINNVLTFASSHASGDLPYLEVSWEPRGIGKQPQFTIPATSLTDKMTMGVNVASGDLFVQSADLHIAGTGLSFDSTRTWNSLNGEDQEYGRWAGSNFPWLQLWGDGSVTYEDASDSWLTFPKKSNGSFVTPAGIHAVMCTTGSPLPCPVSLPGGVAYRLTYDESQTHFDFAADGWPVDVQDRYGNTLTAGYTEGVDGPSSWTDTEGRKIQYTRGPLGYVTEMKDVAGSRTLKYEYETVEGQIELKSYTDANGKTTSYAYEGNNLSKITTPRGDVIKFGYEGSRVTSIMRTTNSEHTAGPTTTLTYYEVGEAPSPCTSTQKATIVKDPDWAAAKAHETTYCSNVLDEVEQTVDASGNVGEASYNPLGNVTSTTASAPGSGESGNVESLGYDESGLNVLCVVTGTSTKITSCPSRPAKSALLTSFSYKDKANPFSSTQVENPEGHSTFGCFNHGEQEESEGHKCPASEAEQPAGSLQNKNDPLASENELKFSYNKNGTIKSSTDADGHTTTYEYDEKGNLKKITPPTGSGISATMITVDADSRPHVITDGAGHIETITYDSVDRITQIAYTGTGTAKTVKFEYDADGNLTKREDPTGTTKYTVDPLNRVTKEELPGSLSNSYEYDDSSNMTAFTDGGGTTKYKYNGLNELESMLEPGESKETKFNYDNDHRLNKITYTSGAIENYKLEPTTGRPETITAEGVTGTTVPKLTYAYKEGENSTSLIQSLTESTGNTTSYLYDKLNRLTEAKIKSTTNPSHYLYKLDGAGNRTSQEVSTTAETGGTKTYFVSNTGNELECRQTVTGACSKNSSTELSAYTYDAGGEQLTITPKSDTSGTTFAYNAASETSSLTPSGSGALALSYGGTGQDDLTALGSTTTLQHAQLGLTREVNSSGTSYYARTPNGLLIDQRTPSGHYNPLYDGQGDIIALVNSSGKVERTFRYGPYGENVKSDGTQTIPYPFGFKAGYRMPGGNKGLGNVTNGLYHYGQRYYDPTTGRWTQQDPASHLGSATQGDLFSFAGSDPINMSDPSGLSEASEFYAYAGGGSSIVAFGCGVAGVATGGAALVGCGIGAGAVSVAIGISAIAEEIF